MRNKNHITIHTSCVSYRKKKSAAKTAHLVFADTKANAKKPKELFFANARMILRRKN